MSGERPAGLSRRIVNELVAHTLGRTRLGRLARGSSRLVPGFAAIVGALNDLSKPAACLRRVQPVRVSRRSLDVIHFPAREVRPLDRPFLALAI